jgi:hypothetical protein
MFDNYIIEIKSPFAGRTVQAGIVVRDGNRFRFFTAADAFYALEAHCFRSLKAAEDAARRCLAELDARQTPAGHRATSGQAGLQHAGRETDGLAPT